jgi:hypothetical protein
MYNLVLTGAILSLTCASHADNTLYQTGFESPDYVAGLPLAGQNTWGEYTTSNTPNASSNGAGLITTSHPASGAQSLQVDAGLLPLLPSGNSGYYYTDYAPNQSFYFSQYPTVRMDVQVRLDGPSTGSTIADDFMSANFSLNDVDGDLAQMWISSDGHVHYYSDADPGPTYDGYLGPAVALGQYHDLAMVLNTGTLTDSFYVDGQYVASLAMPTAAVPDDQYALNLAMVGIQDQPGYDHTQYTAYFDNINLTAVPEPGCPALLVGLVVTSGVLRARRRRPAI